MTDFNKANITRVAHLLREAKSVLFITGAGISADSGLPTYRGIGGLYNDRATADGISIETALSGITLQTHPEITWKYLGQIEQRCRSARYNRAHEVIALVEKKFPRVWVLTQNIDSFHAQAGSRNIIDIHGNMYDIYCTSCGWRRKLTSYSEISVPPKCPQCGRIARPDVVLFGETLPLEKCNRLSKELLTGFDLYFSIGTTSVFPYIRQPIVFARQSQKVTIEINPAMTEVTEYIDIKISLGASQALDMIWESM